MSKIPPNPQKECNIKSSGILYKKSQQKIWQEVSIYKGKIINIKKHIRTCTLIQTMTVFK